MGDVHEQDIVRALRLENASLRAQLDEANARIDVLTREVGRLAELVAKGNGRTTDLLAIARRKQRGKNSGTKVKNAAPPNPRTRSMPTRRNGSRIALGPSHNPRSRSSEEETAPHRAKACPRTPRCRNARVDPQRLHATTWRASTKWLRRNFTLSKNISASG